MSEVRKPKSSMSSVALGYVAEREKTRRSAYIHHAMWHDFVPRLRDELVELRAVLKENAIESRLVRSGRYTHPEDFPYQHAIELKLQDRPLQLRDEHSTVMEQGASLVFSQGPAGDVFVVLRPTRSSLQKNDDACLVIRRFKHPRCIGSRDVKKLARIFLRYSVLTSAFHQPSTGDLIFHWGLWMRNLRWQSAERAKLISFVAWIVPVVIAFISTRAALLAIPKN